MKRKTKHNAVRLAIGFGLLLAAGGATAFGQLNSTAASVTLTATLAESVTVSVTPGTMTFNLVAAGTANGNAPVAITTAWVLASGRANVVLDGYFASASAALSGGTPTVNIPSSEVYGQMTTGTPTSYTAFTQTAALGPSGAGLTLFTQALTGSNRASSRTDNLALQINLTSQAQLPAATYSGTLYLQAQAL